MGSSVSEPKGDMFWAEGDMFGHLAHLTYKTG